MAFDIVAKIMAFAQCKRVYLTKPQPDLRAHVPLPLSRVVFGVATLTQVFRFLANGLSRR